MVFRYFFRGVLGFLRYFLFLFVGNCFFLCFLFVFKECLRLMNVLMGSVIF